MPDQYDSGLSFNSTPEWLNHSYVYRRWFDLEAGRTYHFQTRNLRSWLFGPNPDPVMYLVLGNDIVAYNDDYTGLASEIIYTPSAAGTYLLVLRAYTTATSGYCDLYRGIDGTPPVLIESDVEFAGTYIAARWKAGEWFDAMATDLMQRQDSFLKRYKSMRRGIAELSYDDRAARLAALKRETMGPEYSVPADSSTG